MELTITLYEWLRSKSLQFSLTFRTNSEIFYRIFSCKVRFQFKKRRTRMKWGKERAKFKWLRAKAGTKPSRLNDVTKIWSVDHWNQMTCRQSGTSPTTFSILKQSNMMQCGLMIASSGTYYERTACSMAWILCEFMMDGDALFQKIKINKI